MSTDYTPTYPPLPDPSGAPKVPERVRTVAYVVALVAGAISVASISTVGTLAAAGVMDGTTALVVGAVAGGVTSVISTISGGLGVAFRPTKH